MRRIFNCSQVAVEIKKYVLANFLGDRPVMEEVERNTEYHRLMLTHQPAECGAIACLRLPQHFFGVVPHVSLANTQTQGRRVQLETEFSLNSRRHEERWASGSVCRTANNKKRAAHPNGLGKTVRAAALNDETVCLAGHC